MVAKLERFIKLTDINKTDERKLFERTHSLHIGIIDDFGIELVKISSIYDLDNIWSIYSKLEIRARYNTQRNARICGFWIPNEMLPITKESLRNDFITRSLKNIAFNI